MPEHKSQELEKLKAKLEAFVGVILDQAEKDPDFFIQIETVLNGDLGTIQSGKRRRKKISFDAVTYLSDHNVGGLKQFLLEQEEANIYVIAKQEGLKNLSKKLSKEEAVDRIVEYVSKTLYQGASFLKGSPELTQPSSDSVHPENSQELPVLMETSDISTT